MFGQRMPVDDPRKTVGGSVKAKALHVTSEAECARRYGALKASKWLTGVVQFVEVEQTRTNRTRTLITAEYQLGGGHTKVKKLNIRSVQAATEEQVMAEGHLSRFNKILHRGETFSPQQWLHWLNTWRLQQWGLLLMCLLMATWMLVLQ